MDLAITAHQRTATNVNMIQMTAQMTVTATVTTMRKRKKMNEQAIANLIDTRQRVNELHHTISELRLVSNRLAHALALHTDGDNTPLWVQETYRAWEKLYREHYFREV